MKFEDLVLDDGTINSIAKRCETAQSAGEKVAIKPIANDPDGRMIIVKSDGSYEIVESEPHPRVSTLRSIDQLPSYVNHAVDKWNADPVVYYTPEKAIAVLEERSIRPSRSGKATVILTESPQLKALKGFAHDRNSAWLGHKAFVLLMRIDFEDCINPQQLEYLVKALATLEFQDGSRISSTVSRNRESLGREVLSEIKSLNDLEIPEQIVLMVRLFNDPALLARRQIVCKLETDPTNGRLAILPLANEIENAMDSEMSALGDMLRSSINAHPYALEDASKPGVKETLRRQFVPVFYGTP